MIHLYSAMVRDRATGAIRYTSFVTYAGLEYDKALADINKTYQILSLQHLGAQNASTIKTV